MNVSDRKAMVTLETTVSHAGRTVLVSGGVRGIGRALAEGFLRAGANVAVFHRGESNESKAAEHDLREDFREAVRVGRLLVLKGDVTAKRDRARITSETLSAFGRLDVLVNSAGVCYREDLTPQRIRQQRRINATAPVQFSREVAQILRKNAHYGMETPTRGAIIALSSYVTEWRSFGAEYLRRYAESKRLLERGMKRLACELRPDDVNVNVIAVGVVYAGMGLATIGRKEDALRAGELPVTKFASVDAVVFEALCLTHPRSHYKTGRIEVLDGGWNLGGVSTRR
jgi:NAD(P)-dependent dehydrogenase (short-subunit alcohol dehydrogenase family)